MIFYSLALALALVVCAPYWLMRMASGGKYREGTRERLGFVPARLLYEKSKPVLWVHAVSVGELLAASHMIAELQSRRPEWRIVVSTTTKTGQALARERFGNENVFYFPLDFAFAVRRYLRALRPRLLVLMESEFWPRLLVECERMQIPVAVVNARISSRSWPRYQRLRFFWKRLLNGLALVLAQSETDAKRLKAIGAAHVCYGGNLKFDIRTVEPAPVTQVLKETIPPGTKVLVCGSTLEGEERILLGAAPRDVLSIFAPRHPERFEEVAQLFDRSGRRWMRRSQWLKQPEPPGRGDVLLLDSIGELASVYSLATVAFIGGSLVPAGGHNPLEAVQFGVPVVMGPHYENFDAIVTKLLEANAIRIASPENVNAELAELLNDAQTSFALGERGFEVFAKEAGATRRAVEALLELAGDRA